MYYFTQNVIATWCITVAINLVAVGFSRLGQSCRKTSRLTSAAASVASVGLLTIIYVLLFLSAREINRKLALCRPIVSMLCSVLIILLLVLLIWVPAMVRRARDRRSSPTLGSQL